MTKTRKTPSVPISSVTRYLKQIFGYRPIENCEYWDDALEVIEDSGLTYPAGLTKAILSTERFNIRQSMWGLKPKSPLIQNMLECAEDDSDYSYIVLADDSLPGKESLFLCAVAVADKRFISDMVAFHAGLWSSQSAEPVNIITGGVELGEGDQLAIVALQLSSFKQNAFSM